MAKKIQLLKLDDGQVPFRLWLENLPIVTQAKIFAYIDRVSLGGSKKNVKFLGDLVWEIKIRYGSGYRVYFTEVDGKIILLLVGGDKSTQHSDIKKAKEYRRLYVSK